MITVLIALYYDFIEPIKTAKKSLEKLGANVIGYPMYKFKATEEEMALRYDDFINFISINKPNYILWWNFYVPTEIIRKVKLVSTKTKNYMYNWDDPHCWNSPDYVDKITNFDMAFVSSVEKFNEYKKYGCLPILLYPGFNKKIHYPIIDDVDEDVELYSCDISMCCTNLYEDTTLFNNQVINRKELVDALYKGQKKYGYKFHLYGPPNVGVNYPDSYKREINYVDTNKLFNYSKINICTHVTNANQYINERVILVMASGGLLLVDNVKQIESVFTNGKQNFVILNKANYIKQILSILDNYDSYQVIRSNCTSAVADMDWDNWAKIIYSYF